MSDVGPVVGKALAGGLFAIIFGAITLCCRLFVRKYCKGCLCYREGMKWFMFIQILNHTVKWHTIPTT